MASRFTGKKVPKGVSLPDDLWALLEEYRERVGVPVSKQIQRYVETGIMDDVERRHNRLIDSGIEYEHA